MTVDCLTTKRFEKRPRNEQLNCATFCSNQTNIKKRLLITYFIWCGTPIKNKQLQELCALLTISSETKQQADHWAVGTTDHFIPNQAVTRPWNLLTITSYEMKHGDHWALLTTLSQEKKQRDHLAPLTMYHFIQQQKYHKAPPR